LATAYKRVFEHKKRFLNADREALGVVSLSFEITADIIFLESNNIALVNRLSSLRPRAYICIFSDDQAIKNLTAINFGVYCYPKELSKDAEAFVAGPGAGFVIHNRPEVTILHVETNQRGEIINHRVNRFPKNK
jgi:pyruvate kinase